MIIWYLIEAVDIWYPEVFIGNSVETQNLVSFDNDARTLNSLWYYYPDHKVRYTVILTTKVACNMNFQMFPFDSHECILDIKNWIGASYRLVLSSPKIYKIDMNGQQLGGKEFEIDTHGRLDYNFKFKALESSTYFIGDTTYSMTQVKMLFNRTDKSRQKIFIGYHTTTAIFASLSLLSYFLPIDSVPGRMGMLVTLYLIQMNTYNSIEAPQKRGFSYIEIWFVGIQAPIFLAILEYGILLGIKKFGPHKESFFKNVDLFSLILSTLYLLVFNGFYWLV